MSWKRCLTVAAAAGLTAAASARGEAVTPTLSQDQANRLSLLHDYGLTAIGTPQSVAVPANVANSNDTGLGPTAGVAGGGLMSDLLGPYASTDPAGPDRPFDLTAAPVVAYDSNPEARRLPRGSVFAGGELGAAYHWADGPDDPIVGQPLRATVAYSLLGGAYEGQAENADTLQQNLAGSVRQTLFDNSIVVNATLADAFTMEHGSAFLDTFDAGATGEFFLVPNASIETGFDYAHYQYFFRAITDAAKPTADRYTFVAKAHLYPQSQRRGATVPPAPDVLTELLRAGLRRFTVNYQHVWNYPTQRTGHDYQYQANRIGFGFEGIALPDRVGDRSLGRFGRAVSFDLDYAHEFQTYAFSNSNRTVVLAGHLVPRGGPHRKDGIDVFTVRGNARLFDVPHDAGTVGSYLQWDLIHDGSNITARHFNEYAIGGGLTYQY